MVQPIHNHYPPGRFGSMIAECNCPNPSMDEPSWVQTTTPHTHTAPDGSIVKCFHECKNQLTTLSFWVMTMIAFPIEHAIWTKLPFLSAIAKWAGL